MLVSLQIESDLKFLLADFRDMIKNGFFKFQRKFHRAFEIWGFFAVGINNLLNLIQCSLIIAFQNEKLIRFVNFACK